jgi:hypothetical protein
VKSAIVARVTFSQQQNRWSLRLGGLTRYDDKYLLRKMKHWQGAEYSENLSVEGRTPDHEGLIG